MRRSIITLIFIGIAALSMAQHVDVRARVDKERIQIGDPIQLDVVATYDPQRFVVHFPQIPDTFNGFEITRREKPDTVFKREINEYHQRFTLTHFDSGRWQLPSFSFDVASKQGDATQVQKTDSAWIEVGVPHVDTAQPFKPITDIRGAERPWQDIALEIAAYVLLFAAMLVLIIWGWKKYKRWKAEKNKISPAPILTPFEQAMKELDRIKQEAMYEQGELKLYYTQLTDVLRSYLDKQFGIDSFEKTTSEIMQVVKKHKALANSRQALRDILESADMVKFAKGTPSAEQHMEYHTLTSEVIKESYKKYQNQHINTAS